MKIKTLKDLREEKGLTQEQVSKILGITKEYLSMVERGDRNLSDTKKETFAKFYNVDVADIFLALKETQSFKKKK